MGKQYARKEDVQKLIIEVKALSEAVTEMAIWQAYFTIKDIPYCLSPQMRKDILEKSKNHITHTLYLHLFRTHPLPPFFNKH